MPQLVLTVRTSMTETDIISMMQRGAACFRLNSARLPKDELLKKSDVIRWAARQVDVPVQLFVDLPGHKARIWVLGQRLLVNLGDKITIYLSQNPIDNETIQIVGSEFFSAIKKGFVLLLRRRGHVRLLVEKRFQDRIETLALSTGHIGQGYHVTIEDKYMPNLGLSQADREVIPTVLMVKPDFLCPSFVDVPLILIELKKILKEANINPTLLAKIESPTALQNLHDILAVADGAIVGRDDLAAWLDRRSLHEATNYVIKECQAHGLLAVPASNYFKSLCNSDKLSASDSHDLQNVLSFNPDYLYCNETSISERWDHILSAGKSFGMLHEFSGSRKST